MHLVPAYVLLTFTYQTLGASPSRQRTATWKSSLKALVKIDKRQELSGKGYGARQIGTRTGERGKSKIMILKDFQQKISFFFLLVVLYNYYLQFQI